MEHELEIISGKVHTRPRTRFSVVPSAPGYQPGDAVVEGYQIQGTPPGVSCVTEEVLGPSFLGEGISSGKLRDDHRRDGQGIHR